MSKKKPKEQERVIDYNSIPVEVEIMGRLVKTVDDTYQLNIAKCYGQARGGSNEIAIAMDIAGTPIPKDEIKITYLHELLHFILNFTNFDPIFREKGIDIEQFIELVAGALYQYEKTAKY